MTPISETIEKVSKTVWRRVGRWMISIRNSAISDFSSVRSAAISVLVSVRRLGKLCFRRELPELGGHEPVHLVDARRQAVQDRLYLGDIRLEPRDPRFESGAVRGGA